LQLEYELQKQNGKKLTSVYFGGGTPSLLDIADFEKIFNKIIPHINSDAEITVEANPSSWSLEKATALLNMGANRLSLGVQSLNDEKLNFLSRVHDAKSAMSAYDASKKAGFSNISVDFMYDTPFDDKKFLEGEIADFLALDATHISAYSLTIEEDTPFEKRGVQTRYDADAAAIVAKSLTAAGYEHYEVASFGRIRSRHNFGYWEYKPYIGVGAGAVGFDGNRREYPSKMIEEYIKNPLLTDTEELSADNITVEKILLGLRSTVGVELSILSNKQNELKTLLQNNLLRSDGKRVYATDFFLADELTLRLS
jgi:oxygen-independent coproporphyrinogen-3 oxidase